MYGDHPSGFLYLDDDEYINGFSVNSAWDAAIRDLYEVARLVPSAINWDDNFVVTDPAFIAGMPDWLLNVLTRPPVVVHSGDEVIQRIARS